MISEIANLDKYKNSFVSKAQEVNRILRKLSLRSEALETESLKEVETSDQKALKKRLSYNSTYSIFDLIKGYLLKFQSTNVVREILIKNKPVQEEIQKYLKNYDSIINKIINKAFNEPNDFILIDKKGGIPLIRIIPINSIYYYDDITLIYELDISENENKVYRKIEYINYNNKIGYWDFILRQKTDGKFYISQKAKEKPQIFGFNDLRILDICPFEQIGDVFYTENIKDSLIFTVIEKFKVYKRDSDIFEISKILHAFPEKITLGFDCKNCNGEGFVKDDSGSAIKCNICNGTGTYWIKNPAEVMKVPQMIPSDMKPYMSEVIKYVEKDIKTLEFQRENLKQLEQEITYHATGLKNIAINSLKTATEVQENQVPLNSRINKIIKFIQNKEVWILTVFSKLFTDKPADIFVKYQMFYVGKTVNNILEEIKKSKEIGLNFSYLQLLYKDLILAYYQNDTIKQKEQLKLLEIEPYPFYTIAELKNMELLLDKNQLKIKLELLNYIGQLDLKKEPEQIKKELLIKILANESIDK